MQQPPVEFPVAQPQTSSRRSSGSHSHQSVEPESSIGRQGYIFTLRTSLALVALACLGLYIAARLPQWDTLFSRQSAAADTGDPVLASMLQWVPILLIMVSSVVLALMAVLSLRERRPPHRVHKLELVPPPSHAAAQAPVAMASQTEARTPDTNASRPFLVGDNNHRYEAREEIRLSRDARVSAAQRSAAVSQLRITPAVPHPEPPDAPDPVVRRGFVRRKALLRDKVPAAITLNRPSPNEIPPATA